MFGIEDGGGNDANCITLLHLDNNETNSSSTSQAWTRNWYTEYSSSIKKFGTHCICDTYRTEDYPVSVGFTQSGGIITPYLSSDWTVEAWLYIPKDSYYDSTFHSGIFNMGAMTGSEPHSGYFSLDLYSGHIRLKHSTNGSSYDFNTAYTCTIPRTAWFHFAVVKKDNKITVYINGAAVLSNVTWSYNPNSNYKVASINHYSYFYMDEFRFSNCARWTKDFIPPTAAYS